MNAEEYLEKKRLEKIQRRKRLGVLMLMFLCIILMYLISVTDNKSQIVFMSGFLWKFVSIIYNEVNKNEKI